MGNVSGPLSGGTASQISGDFATGDKPIAGKTKEGRAVTLGDSTTIESKNLSNKLSISSTNAQPKDREIVYLLSNSTKGITGAMYVDIDDTTHEPKPNKKKTQATQEALSLIENKISTSDNKDSFMQGILNKLSSLLNSIITFFSGQNDNTPLPAATMQELKDTKKNLDENSESPEAAEISSVIQNTINTIEERTDTEKRADEWQSDKKHVNLNNLSINDYKNFRFGNRLKDEPHIANAASKSSQEVQSINNLKLELNDKFANLITASRILTTSAEYAAEYTQALEQLDKNISDLDGNNLSSEECMVLEDTISQLYKNLEEFQHGVSSHFPKEMINTVKALNEKTLSTLDNFQYRKEGSQLSDEDLELINNIKSRGDNHKENVAHSTKTIRNTKVDNAQQTPEEALKKCDKSVAILHDLLNDANKNFEALNNALNSNTVDKDEIATHRQDYIDDLLYIARMTNVSAGSLDGDSKSNEVIVRYIGAQVNGNIRALIENNRNNHNLDTKELRELIDATKEVVGSLNDGWLS